METGLFNICTEANLYFNEKDDQIRLCFDAYDTYNQRQAVIKLQQEGTPIHLLFPKCNEIVFDDEVMHLTFPKTKFSIQQINIIENTIETC